MGRKKKIKSKSTNGTSGLTQKKLWDMPWEERKKWYAMGQTLAQKIDTGSISPDEVALYITIATAEIDDPSRKIEFHNNGYVESYS